MRLLLYPAVFLMLLFAVSYFSAAAKRTRIDIDDYVKEIWIENLPQHTLGQGLTDVSLIGTRGIKINADYEERFGTNLYLGFRKLTYIQTMRFPFTTILQMRGSVPVVKTFSTIQSWNENGRFVRMKHLRVMPEHFVEIVNTPNGYDVVYHDRDGRIEEGLLFKGQDRRDNGSSYVRAIIEKGCLFRYRAGVLEVCKGGSYLGDFKNEEQCIPIEIGSESGDKIYVDTRDITNQCEQMHHCDKSVLEKEETRHIPGSMCSIGTNLSLFEKLERSIRWARNGFGEIGGKSLVTTANMPRIQELIGMSCQRPIYLLPNANVTVKRRNRSATPPTDWPTCGDVDYLVRNPRAETFDLNYDCRFYSKHCCSDSFCKNATGLTMRNARYHEIEKIQDMYPALLSPENDGEIEIHIEWIHNSPENLAVALNVSLFPSEYTEVFIGNVAISGKGHIRGHEGATIYKDNEIATLDFETNDKYNIDVETGVVSV